jgi:hypothetical protein
MCPDAEWVHRAISRYISVDLAELRPHTVRATGTIVQRGDHYELVLTLDAGAGASDSRTLLDADCRLLAQAAALMVAVAVDPDSAVRALTIDPPPILPMPPAREPIAEPTRIRPVVKPPLSPTPTTNHATTPVTPVRCSAAPIGRRVARAPRSICAALGVRGALQAGVLPQAIEPGVQGEVAVLWPRIRVELGGSHWPHRSVRDDSGRGGDLQLSAAHVAGCFRVGTGPLEVPLCTGLEVGALGGVGAGIARPKRDVLAWGAAILGSRLMWPFVRRAALVAQADLVLPFDRYVFTIGGTEQIHRTDAVAGRGMLGVELRLP